MRRFLFAAVCLVPAVAWGQSVGFPGLGVAITAAGTTVARTLENRAADSVNVKDTGARGDGKILTAVVTTAAGSTALHVAASTFAATDVGKTIIIGNAGAATTTAPVLGIPVTAPGDSYTAAPACAVTDSGGGTGATCAAVMTVQSATLASGGTGCPNGAQTFFLKQVGNYSIAQITGTVTGGVLSGPLVVSVAGQYPTVPTVSGATITNGDCATQPTANVSFGVGFVQTTAWGSGYAPATTAAALSGGTAGTAATLGTPQIGIVVSPWVGTIQTYAGPTDVTVSTQAGSALTAKSVQLFYGSDDAAAIQAAINLGTTEGIDVYVPGGVYYVGTPLNPGAGPITIRGSGANSSVLFWDPGSTSGNYGQLNSGWKPLLTNVNALTTPNSLAIRDIQFRGTYDFGRQNIGAAAVVINNYGEMLVDRIKAYEIPNMFTQCESIKRVRVTNSTFDTVMRDQVRFRSSFFVLVDGNHFSHSDDDSVALHQASFITGAGNVREGMIVTNNFFEDTTGVHIIGARNLIVRGNVFDREKIQAISISPSTDEGIEQIFNITIADNIITNGFARPPFSDVMGAVIGVTTQPPAASTAIPQLAPGAQLKGTNYFVPPWTGFLNDTYNGTGGSPPAFGIDIHDNTILRTLPATASYSSWGRGTVMTDYGFVDPPVPNSGFIPTAGISVTTYALGQKVHNNQIFNVQRGVQITGTQTWTSMSSISIDNNTIFDSWEAGIYDVSGTGNKASTRISNNDITVDPYSINPNRFDIHGAWNFGSTSGQCIFFQTGLVIITDNLLKECWTATNGATPQFASRNWVFGAIFPGFTGLPQGQSNANLGIGSYPYFGTGFNFIPIVADPSATFASFEAASSTHPLESTTMPTGNLAYKAGEFVRSLDPISCSCFGWMRMTSSSANNVAGTDWKVIPLQ